MSELKFGIVGTGFIAGMIANAIGKSRRAKLAAVSSRNRETAEAFVAKHSDAAAVEGVAALLARDDVEAVYVATPTAKKEEITFAALDSNKHVLVEKPFPNHAAVKRIAEDASAKGLAFMDATHFVHHPRTQTIQIAIPEMVGTPRSLHAAFFFPISDRTDIRYDQALEPMGALGDMGWYSMRAVVEYLKPQGAPSAVAAVCERDTDTGAIIRASGLLGFESGEATTFDVGYTVGTPVMDLSLRGTRGLIALDDFVLDWVNSIVYQNPDIKAGFVHRTGMATRKDIAFVETPSELAQEVLMIDHFADLVVSGDRDLQTAYVEASSKTQQYLDTIWGAVQARNRVRVR